MSDYGTVDEIKEKIRKNTYQTELKDSTRNTLWQHFQAITAVIDGDRRTLPYVQCSKCLHLLSYDSKRGGTSHLWRHADLCAAPASATPSVTSFFSSTCPSHWQPSRKYMTDVLNLCARTFVHSKLYPGRDLSASRRV